MSDVQDIKNKESVPEVLALLLIMEPLLLKYASTAGLADGSGLSEKTVSRIVPNLEDRGIVEGLYSRRHQIHGLRLLDRPAAEALYEELTGEPFKYLSAPPE